MDQDYADMNDHCNDEYNKSNVIFQMKMSWVELTF